MTFSIMNLITLIFALILYPTNGNYLFQASKPVGEDADDRPEMWSVENDLDYLVMNEDSAHPLVSNDGDLIDYGTERRMDWVLQSIIQQEMMTNPDESNDTINEVILPKSTKPQPAQQKNSVTFDFHPNMDVQEVREIQGRLMANHMDTTANPCEDFYQYACGNWDKHNPTPDDAAGFDTFEKLRESLNVILRGLLEEEVDPALDSKAVIKAKHLYRSCIDVEKLEERKEKPLLKLLEDLGGWPMLSKEWSPSGNLHWIDVMSRLRLFNNDILVSMWVGPDGKNSESHIVQLDQGDLALPSRAYYLGHENFTSVLNAYSDFIRGTALALGGVKEVVDQDVADLLEFETELALILIPAEERRNFSAMYRKVTLTELNEMTEIIPWTRYLSTVLNRSVNETESVVIYASSYFPQLAALVNQTEDRVLSNYLLWRFIRHRLNNLDQRFQDLKQELYSVLYGRKQQPERWKYCISYVNGNMGMAVGSLFVKNYFSEDSKNDTTQLIAEVQDVFNGMLDTSDWLDYDTKIHAKEKLAYMNLKIGYPDYILDNSTLDSEFEEIEIEPDLYFENVLRMLRYVVQEELSRLNKSVDREQWSTTPAVVNAYYSRTRNQIMIPAGILQPPFFNPSFPKALNYGGIGVVIGHEITHGFDDQGRQFDTKGNLQPWWPEDTARNFETRTKCIIDQYSNYTNLVADFEVRVNGIITQGENIADNGGIRQAFKAYERWLHSNPGAIEDELMPGLNATARQLFFLSFGQVWCGSLRPEAAISKMKTAVHAPGRFRVIGSLSNMQEFSDVFACPKGSRMNPSERCIVW